MVQIKVLYFGMLRELAGKREERVEIEGSSSLSDLVRVISEKHNSKFRNFVFESDGKLREGFAFAADGSSVAKSRLRQIRCREVSEFAILPPISGGAE